LIVPLVPDSLVAALAAAYRVDRELGVGGMATVYLAHDIKHGRDVAIKVLHPELGAALGADRFLSEIRTTAKLQHPHILPLLDSGSVTNARGDAEWLYYVMPLVTGETLRARLERERQLPIAECVRIAREVASALDYAHRQGVVHRDIKPENILLHDGSALVADFGIALAVQSAGGQRMTQTGLSLGTPQYMSPEQAMGERSVDARSDVYSLGAVTYEMLTGEPPFTGATVQAIVAKVLTERPVPVTTTREMVSAGVEHAVLTALAKLPADRFSTAAEFSTALGDQSFSAPVVTGAPGVRFRPAGWRARLRDPLVLALGGLAITLPLMALTLARRPAPEPFPFRMELTTGDVSVTGEAVIAPDGNSVAFIGSSKTCSQRCLFFQRLDQLEPRLLPGTSGAANPSFSPDGKWIAFVSNRSMLKKAPVDGGEVATLATVAEWSPIAWTSTNELLLGSGIDEGRLGILRMNVAGGEAVPLTRVDTLRGDHSHQSPMVLADGRTVIFTILKGALERSELALTSLDDGKVYPLGISGTRAIGMVDGRLLYGRADGVLMAVPFDVRRRRVSGGAVPVLDSIGLGGFKGDASGAHVNADGGLVFVRGSPATRLVWVDRAGHATPAIADVRDFAAIRISPDGRQVALSVRAASSADIWIADLGGVLTRLTNAAGARNPVWSGDGRQIYFVSTEGGRPEIWSQRVDGSRPAVKIKTPGRNAWNLDMTPDGHTAMFNSLDEHSWDVFTLTLDSTAIERPFAASPRALETWARFSPDSRAALYASNESGRPEIYVRAIGDSGSRVQISTGGSNKAVWARDGRAIFYQEGDAMMAAALARDPALRVASRTPLFRGPFGQEFDVAPDGSRFLMLEPVAERGAGMKLVVVPNWRTELRRKLGLRP
jgi:Tol biopolymer transport system component